MHSSYIHLLGLILSAPLALASTAIKAPCPYPPTNFQVYAEPIGQYLALGAGCNPLCSSFFSVGPGDLTFSLENNTKLQVTGVASHKHRAQVVLGHYAFSIDGEAVERVFWGSAGVPLVCRLTASETLSTCDLMCQDPSAGVHQNGSSVNTANANQWFLGSQNDCVPGDFCPNERIRIKAMFADLS